MVCTIEKANSIINHLIKTKMIHKYRTVVIDEVHMMGDRSRGYLLELVINKLLYMQSVDRLDLQLICLSATLPNIADIVQYTNSACFVATHRPNPLSEYLIVDAPFPVNPSAPIRFSIRRVVCFAAIRRSPPSISRWSLPAGN